MVLDNASVHRNKKIKELRSLWEQRGLFIFYLPPYSPQLNIAETLWRILKGKWIDHKIIFLQTHFSILSTERWQILEKEYRLISNIMLLNFA
ncbi:transposase [Bacteroides sp.]|uniref:transposase n=1 Tax=Bacteroides sp. TaxID=29523 RepID=UPI0025C1E88F|nr:transposase [Bacteroides sp.]